MNQEKKITVIMGLYNCQDYLSEAIDSIIAQSYSNWELVMCDDGSTDQTYTIAKEYVDLFPNKICLIKNERNMYLAYSLNQCLKYATGFYIARMDADDVSAPLRFEKEVEFLEKHPDVDMVGTEMLHFNEDGYGNIEYVPSKPDKYILKKDQPFIHATIMTYKTVYDALGGYTVEERTSRAQDLDLWFRFYAMGFRGDNIHEPLYLMRENRAAFKRRTFKTRLNTYKTTRIGYRMLDYPKWWIIKPTAELLFKSLIPYPLWIIYRKYQQRKDNHLKMKKNSNCRE